MAISKWTKLIPWKIKSIPGRNFLWVSKRLGGRFHLPDVTSILGTMYGTMQHQVSPESIVAEIHIQLETTMLNSISV